MLVNWQWIGWSLRFFKNIYAFIYGCDKSYLLCTGFLYLHEQGAPFALRWGAQASHCAGFSCWGAQALGAGATVIVVQGLSCSVACGIFPDQGLNLSSPHWQMLNHWPTREVPRMQCEENRVKWGIFIELLPFATTISYWVKQVKDM